MDTRSAIATHVGRELARLRTERGLSRRVLARMADTSESTLERLERGATDPPLTLCLVLCTRLGTHLDCLLPPSYQRPTEPRAVSLTVSLPASQGVTDKRVSATCDGGISPVEARSG
jgi:transcriptional regulator with XRE-family HTH domain